MADELVVECLERPQLGTRVRQMVAELEGLYGDRDRTIKKVEVEFVEGIPRPDTVRHSEGLARVRLLAVARGLPSETEYELAHECVHLLHPLTYDTVRVLEEGLAFNYSWDLIQRTYPGHSYNPEDQRTYVEAGKLAKAFLEKKPGAIKDLRRSGSGLSNLTAAMLLAQHSDFDRQAATHLADLFAGWNGP